MVKESNENYNQRVYCKEYQEKEIRVEKAEICNPIVSQFTELRSTKLHTRNGNVDTANRFTRSGPVYVLVKLAVNLDSADRTWNASSLPELGDDSC
jgi:hypothetical protein